MHDWVILACSHEIPSGGDLVCRYRCSIDRSYGSYWYLNRYFLRSLPRHLVFCYCRWNCQMTWRHLKKVQIFIWNLVSRKTLLVQIKFRDHCVSVLMFPMPLRSVKYYAIKLISITIDLWFNFFFRRSESTDSFLLYISIMHNHA